MSLQSIQPPTPAQDTTPDPSYLFGQLQQEIKNWFDNINVHTNTIDTYLNLIHTVRKGNNTIKKIFRTNRGYI